MTKPLPLWHWFLIGASLSFTLTGCDDPMDKDTVIKVQALCGQLGLKSLAWSDNINKVPTAVTCKTLRSNKHE